MTLHPPVPDAPPALVVAGADAASDERPRLAAIYGADFSALSITPSRGDRAPSVVRSALPRFAPWNAATGTDLTAWHVVDMGDAGAHRLAWEAAFEAITATVVSASEAAEFTIGLGGDHSVTYPIGMALAGRCTRLGIIQLDVHHDVRPISATPSNGSPIRGLIEAGRVAPEDVVQIGIHPYANRRELTEYCDEYGIRRYSLTELRQMGASACIAAAREALAHCDHIHLTVDIDVLDRAFAPGTVAALPGGITPDELSALVDHACADPLVRSMDVVEFDPERDVSSITAYNVAHVVMIALHALARRRSTR